MVNNKRNYIPNLITITRILGTIVLIFVQSFSSVFLIIYLICGISDILDGMIARKLNVVSITGQIIDSIADLFMMIVILSIFMINIKIPLVGIYWIIIIAIIRLVSLGIGFMRYKQLTFLHTYANKITGIALFCLPFIYVGLGIYKTIFIVCIIASFSAIEELIINIVSKELCRDIKSIFSL